MKNAFKNFFIFVVAILLIAIVFSFYNIEQPKKPENISLANLSSKIQNEEVKKIEIVGDSLDIELNNGELNKAQKEKDESLTQTLINLGSDKDKLNKVDISVKDESGLLFWATTILPFLLPFLFVGIFIWFMFRRVQGANSKALSFGESGAKLADKKKKFTFKDVAGAIEAKEELREVVEFLRDPQKFIKLGAEIPKGVLLLGAPGIGKTLLARAVAGEADVPFFHISGSEFVEMFVGVGASRVRDLFKKAKKASPCIVFIDEIDAVGRHRGAGLGGGHDEREQTLNQILVEMDGFDNETNIIVLAATNRPDVLDPALLRPGRFDRQVIIDLPDMNDRYSILKLHAANKPLEENVDLEMISKRTPGFSGADLRNVLNESAILAAKQNKKRISQLDILNSIEKVMLGPERKSHILSEKEKSITAYHEAGHALVGHLLSGCDPIHKISIISRGRAAGYTMKLPDIDKHLHTKTEFIDDIAMTLGGLVSEKIIFGEITNGASSDLQQVSDIAKKMITKYAMNEDLGYRSFGQNTEMVFLGREIHENKDYSEDVAKKIDLEIKDLVDMCYKKAEDIIIKNREKLDQIANKLLEKETIEKEEFENMF
ncbi:MAG: ATP-dependent zinc metalloprotease FtsH [Patescibacteria group bacterium]|nr:ATP-dependent zinc metalloprotease FtsH [Patescibacteria group bacterium]MDD4303902.1 ATP-dependent zinc metalloprotease FtsH [Patescibacteria group bacterium]MDD4695111.1 ATP-dependent zinc metalloprotease FtsH [Patescibacteria group bacterium]